MFKSHLKGLNSNKAINTFCIEILLCYTVLSRKHKHHSSFVLVVFQDAQARAGAAAAYLCL